MGYGRQSAHLFPFDQELTHASVQVNLIETFGIVPQSVFPESFNSSNSSKVDGLLTTKLREYALELRELTASAMRALQDLEGKSFLQQMEIAVQSARKRKVEQASRPKSWRSKYIC